MDIDIEDLNLTMFSVVAQREIQKFTGDLTVIQYVANVVHCCINIYFAYGVYATSLMHPNLKILVITIATQYSFIALGRIGETLNTTVFVDKPIVVTNLVCVMCKLINDSALITSCTSMLLMGTERLIATVKSRLYAYRNSNIGVIMLASTVSVGLFFSLSTVYYDIFVAGTFDLYETKTSCQNLFTHPLVLPLCWCFALVTFVIGTTMMYVLFHYNKMMMEKYRNHPLPVRYVYNENIATLRVLAPAVAGYGFMTVCGMIISVYAFYALLSTSQNSFDVQMAFQFLYMIADFYGIYFVAYVLIKFRPMRKRLRRHLLFLFQLPQTVVNAVGAVDRADAGFQTDVYFKQLADVWNPAKQGLNRPAANEGKQRKQLQRDAKIKEKENSRPPSRNVSVYQAD